MWLLTHDGDHLEGKRRWLRPGQSHLFGRTKIEGSSDPTRFTIDSRSVSRHHLTITVESKEATWSDPFVASTVILTDCSKLGTKIDGAEFTKCTKKFGGKVSENESHTIQLGKWDKLFHLQWFPVNIALTAALSKSPIDPIERYRSRLGPLDVGVSVEYIHGKTTHVLANKRNTPKGLQALVNGKHIVTDKFVEALENASIQPPARDEVEFSPLEDDFDRNWPNEMDYLPGPGKEPTPRSADFFKPDTIRASVFTGFTFIFCDPGQFDTLQPAITEGGGKALLYELQHGTTPPDALASYVKGIAGDKGKGELEDGSEGRGVVVVRTGRTGAQSEQWILQFFPQVDVQLGQRSIEQNEFLDAILINNASLLRRALEEDLVGSSLPPTPYASIADHQAAQSAMRAPQQPTPTTDSIRNSTPMEEPAKTEPRKPGRRGISRAITTSFFKGFDEFDSFDIPKVEQSSAIDNDYNMEDQFPNQINRSIAGPSRTFASQAQAQNDGSKLPPAESVEVSDEEDANDVVDRILPAATAMKRRRLQQQQDSAAREEFAPVDGGAVKSPRKRALELPSDLRKTKQSKLKEEIDVKGLAKAHRDKEEEARRKDEEFLREGMNGLDIESMRDLAKVEEMEIKPRSGHQARRANSEQGDETGWKEEWNGRKNFKKFRKRRSGDNEDGATEPIRARKVIVPLEEVQREGYGRTPDEYFLESSRRTQRTPSQSLSQSQSQLRGQNRRQFVEEDDVEDAPQFRRTTGRRLATVAPTTPAVEVVASDDEHSGDNYNGGPGVTDQDDAGQTRQKKTTQKSTQKVTQTQRSNANIASSTVSSGKGRGKRGVPQPAPEPPGKRAVRAPLGARNDDDDSSEDELKFRRRRKV